MSKWIVAFAGPGDVTYEAASELLDDWLPEDDLTVYLPASIGRGAKGLKLVKKWLETVEQEFSPVAVGDMVADLLAEKADDTEVFLVVLWGEEGDKVTSELVEEAIDAGIPVKDLTSALDDISFDDDAPEEEDDQPEPVQGPEPKAKRPTKKELEEAAKKTLDGLSDLKKNYAVEAQDSEDVLRAAQRVPEAVTGPSVQVEAAQLLLAIEGYVRALVEEILPKPEPVGRPRKDGQPAGSVEPTVTVIADEHGVPVRLAGRGRPRKGETRMEITVAEAKALELYDEE